MYVCQLYQSHLDGAPGDSCLLLPSFECLRTFHVQVSTQNHGTLAAAAAATLLTSLAVSGSAHASTEVVDALSALTIPGGRASPPITSLGCDLRMHVFYGTYQDAAGFMCVATAACTWPCCASSPSWSRQRKMHARGGGAHRHLAQAPLSYFPSLMHTSNFPRAPRQATAL